MDDQPISVYKQFDLKQSVVALVVTILFLFAFQCSLCLAAYAKSGGEIINISHQHKIAFTDVGRTDLSPGDIVKVQISSNKIIYLKVLESSAALSKLGFVNTRHFNTDPEMFKQIAVGNSVVKVSESAAAVSVAPPVEEKAVDWGKNAMEDELKKKTEEINGLKNELVDVKNRNAVLMQELSELSLTRHVVNDEKDRRLKEIDELKSVIRVLEKKLKNMEKMTEKILNQKR